MRIEPEELRERSERCVEAFVLRARRVEAHSIASDRQQLLRWAKHEITVQGHADGRTFVIFTAPPEEQLESVAARVRPFILDRDPIYHRKVFNAVGYLLRAAGDPVRQELAKLATRWAAIDPHRRTARGFEMQVSNKATGESGALADNVLAFAWIYGDTIHADEGSISETRIFGVSGRFEAAVPLVCQIVVRAIETLNFIREVTDLGLFSVSDSAFSAPVIVTETEFRKEATVFVAPVGTASPSVDEPFGDAWRELRSLGDLEERPPEGGPDG